jgi:zinc transport system substrate-binding protein
MRRGLLIFLFFAAISFCRSAAEAQESMQVFAGIPPVANLVERIGGEHVKVEVLIEPGQDPHTYEPLPKQVQSLAKAKLFFKVGMPFEERLLEKIRGVQEKIVVVDTASGVKKRLAQPDDEHDLEGDAKKNRHDEGDYDPHVWLSPLNLKIQAATIAEALENSDSAHAADYRDNLKKLDAEIDVLHEKICKRMKPFAGRAFYVFHPAFGYFADCYGLKQSAVQVGGKQPSPKQLRGLIHQARAAKTKVIFVQPQFDPHSARTIAEAIGGKVVTLNDMSPDVLANLEEIAVKIETAFK